MTVIAFPPRQTPYFPDLTAVIDFAQSMERVGLLTEQHRLELIALPLESNEINGTEALEALANLIGQHG